MSPSSAPLSDSELIAALQRHEPRACATFIARFRPVLEAFVRKANIPPSDWPACITELLSDEALRLSAAGIAPPRCLGAYLTRAARNKYFYIKRAETCRSRKHLDASTERCGEQIIPSICSEHARRSSAGPDASPPPPTQIIVDFGKHINAQLSANEQQLLGWVAEGISRAIIAEWLGISRDACTKRVWRLCHRLRRDITARVAYLAPRDRAEIERLLRRARQSRATTLHQ